MGCGTQVNDAEQSIAHVVAGDFTVDVVQYNASGGSGHNNNIVLHADGESWRRSAASENASVIDIMHAAALNGHKLVRTSSILCPDPETTLTVGLLTADPNPVYAAGRANGQCGFGIDRKSTRLNS